jgi:hypothetical protein
MLCRNVVHQSSSDTEPHPSRVCDCDQDSAGSGHVSVTAYREYGSQPTAANNKYLFVSNFIQTITALANLWK